MGGVGPERKNKGKEDLVKKVPLKKGIRRQREPKGDGGRVERPFVRPGRDRSETSRVRPWRLPSSLDKKKGHAEKTEGGNERRNNWKIQTLSALDWGTVSSWGEEKEFKSQKKKTVVPTGKKTGFSQGDRGSPRLTARSPKARFDKDIRSHREMGIGVTAKAKKVCSSYGENKQRRELIRANL